MKRRQRPTVQSLDARLSVVEEDVADIKRSQHESDSKLNRIEGAVEEIRSMMEEHGRTTRVRLTMRARVITTLIGAIGGVLTAWLAGGCL